MKTLRISLFITSLSIFLNHGYAREDFFAKIAGEPKVSMESDKWFNISIPFSLHNNPSQIALNGTRPSSVEQAFNPEFIDNFKIKILICFSNEFNKRLFRANNLPESSFYEYYGAEIEFATIKMQRSIQYGNFLFPVPIAERNGYGKSRLTLTGYAIEFFIDGSPLELSNSIYFGKYKDEATLNKFKEIASEKSSSNRGILLPGHYFFPNLSPSGSVPKFPHYEK